MPAPAKDDGILYWLPTHALVYGNDSEAARRPYWLAFREAADELYRAYSREIEFPAGIDAVWRTPRFEAFRKRYSETWSHLKSKPQGAFKVIRRYQLMKILQRYVHEPIELLTKVGATEWNAIDDKRVEIDGIVWHYSKLDGNHRLMAAFYAGLDRVPVYLLPEQVAPDNQL